MKVYCPGTNCIFLTSPGAPMYIILFYLIYNNFFNNIDNKEVKEKNEIVKSEISHEEFLKTLTEELQKLRKSMVTLNENYLKSRNGSEELNKQFKKDIIKKNIIIDTINIDTTSNPENHSTNYVINFGADHLPEVYKNVIGFRLINAIIPYTFYTVHENNNTIHIGTGIGDVGVEIILDPGQYTFTDLGTHLETKINDTSLSGYTVTPNTKDLTYTISHTDVFNIRWEESTSNRLFGFPNKNISGANSYVSVHEADHSVHYVDLVITEIPSAACKINSKGREIISRIPFNAPSGSLIFYRSPPEEFQSINYFYPIKLSQLTIQLFDDYNSIYDCNNADNSFEFELTILQNPGLMK